MVCDLYQHAKIITLMANITLSNLGTVNKNKVTISSLSLWFSYETIVAFSHPSVGFICSKNNWSMTTGKLLNEICPDKTKRMPHAEFEKAVNDLLLTIPAV